MNKYAKLFIFTAIYDIFISSLSDVNTEIISIPNAETPMDKKQISKSKQGE